VLDPTYTGKVLAGVINLVKTGRFGPQDTLVFLHTGGTPIVFAKADELSKGANIRHVRRQDYAGIALPA
jgi:hypothetical protein